MQVSGNQPASTRRGSNGLSISTAVNQQLTFPCLLPLPDGGSSHLPWSWDSTSPTTRTIDLQVSKVHPRNDLLLNCLISPSAPNTYVTPASCRCSLKTLNSFRVTSPRRSDLKDCFRYACTFLVCRAWIVGETGCPSRPWLTSQLS